MSDLRLSRSIPVLAVVMMSAGLAAAAARQPAGAAPPFEKIVLSASLFKTAWAYKNDRPWLEAQLAWLKRHQFDAIRAFGVVGDPAKPDYWDGREIDWRWKDYASVVAGATDLAYDKYGIRVQWTIFADAQKNIPRGADRSALIDLFLRISRGREHKILAFEVANESWKNGFEGPGGVRQLQEYAARLRGRTTVPVAASTHRDELCPLYAAGAVDFTTLHFDRSARAARWTPLTEPWTIARQPGHFAKCELPRWASNNEPLGPGSSVPQPLTPLQVVMAAVNTYAAGIPVYVFHTGPGVRDDPTHPQGLRPSGLQQLPGAEQFFGGLAAVKRYVPADIVSFRSVKASDRDFPFLVKGKTVAALGATRKDQFVVAISGAAGQVDLIARRPLRMRVVDPLSGHSQESRVLAANETFRLTREAAVLIGSLGSESR